MRTLILGLVLFCTGVSVAFGLRIVVLYPAASPVLRALGVPDGEVVGVTRHDRTYPRAVRVGSHLRPNLELIRALRPDLLVVGSRRAFPEEAARRFKARIFRYDPRTLEEILARIEALGEVLGRRREAEDLVASLRKKLAEVKPLPRPVTVVYEVSATPLKVAGSRSIVNDIIRVAGGRNLVAVPRKHVLISPERILALAPEVYIYQVGPMNRNPLPPKRRPYFRALKSRVLRVRELEFARPGLNAFSATIKLNRFFLTLQK
ncbi:ABC transporter substrate-binding protein [Thermosulfurimonas sp. F29]|uniref:ABC transporter substrate-binding protein n=1 Tax=Thermosulfurimonas sp. F29 TaxID=2867247 RepID=UPI001C835CD0|nr:ABC transporter substrate-binding protein [Thermosulfurimonas sp. F29]MBX6423699.1 ABC transporter substrate-binding protein [Thermosulfurimonas sp. F29]